MLSGLLVTPPYAAAAPLASTITVENANVKLVLTPTTSPAGETWAVGEVVKYNLTLTNKTTKKRGFKIRSTNFDWDASNTATAEGCRWTGAEPKKAMPCKGKLTHTITQADVAAGGFTPSLVYNMYNAASYESAPMLAGGTAIPATSKIKLLNPKASDAGWNVGEVMRFSVELTNDTGIKRSFEIDSTNLSGTDKCRWGEFNNGVTANCNSIEITHKVDDSDFTAGYFTPSIAWKMYPVAQYKGAAEILAPTVGEPIKIGENLALVSFTQSEDSKKETYSAGDELLFTLVVKNSGDVNVAVKPELAGGNVTFDESCTAANLAPNAELTCTVRYALTNESLAQGKATPIAILTANNPDGAELDRVTASAEIPVKGTFAKADAFTAYDANPAGASVLSDLTMIAKTDSDNNMRIPAIAVAQNGDILAAYDARPRASEIGKKVKRAGGDSPNENSIMQKRSTDGGKTWQSATTIAAGKIGSHGYSDPSYVVDHTTGTIFNFHVYSQDAGLFTGQPTSYVYKEGKIDETDKNAMNLGLSISRDNGYTWEQRVVTNQVLNGIAAQHKFVGCFATSGAGTQKQQEPHKGRLLQQVACITDTNGNGKGDNNVDDVVAFTMYSDDHGQTWNAGTPTDPYALGTDNSKRMRFDENKVVELSDGSLMLNSRTATWNGKGYRLVALSKDGGQTWSDYRVDETLIDPGNNAQLIRAFPNANAGTLRSQVVLFSNTAHAKSRTNGAISLSCDDGKTWGVRKQFRGAGTGYTTMAVQSDGNIGLLMEPNGGGWQDIGYQSFNLSWVAGEGQLCSELSPVDTQQVEASSDVAINPIKVADLFTHNDPLLADTVSVEGLPEGLSYNAQTGVIEGTPTEKLNKITDYTVSVTMSEESDGTKYERKATAKINVRVTPTGGRTWYVAADGSDSNDGLSPERPFQTLAPVNKLDLLPGDAVYLKRGDVFNDQYMHLKGSGSADAPIIISAYGEASDPLPIINTNGEGVWYEDYNTKLDNPSHKQKGNVSTSILLKDVEYIEVSELEITNKRQDDQDPILKNQNAMDRTGVAVIAENIGTVNHVVLKKLYVHDVDGNVYNKHMANGGIYVIAHKPKDESATGIARFDDVQVVDNRVEDVSRWGIGVGYTGYTKEFHTAQLSDETVARYGQTDVVVRGNYVKRAGGDAITVFYALRPLVEYNVSVDASKYINTEDYPGTFGRVAAGIWPWKTKDAVFQYNEAFNTLNGAHGNGDAMPWDSDWSDGTLYQYNYSAGNTGGTYMICGVQAINSTFRYNISQNDIGGLLDPVDRNPNGHIYNNTFYVAKDVPILKTIHTPNGRATIENNIFYYTGDTPRNEDWNRSDGGGFTKTYRNNLYYNYANTPASDSSAIKVTAGTQVFAGERMQLAPSEARADFLTYRLPSDVVSANDTLVTNNANEAPASQSDVFAGYRLADNSPATDTGKTITDENGFTPEADFFGDPLVGATDIGAVQHAKVGELSSTIYLVTRDSDGVQMIHVPQTAKNPTTVSEVLENVAFTPKLTLSVVDASGNVVDGSKYLTAGMKVRATDDSGKYIEIPLQITNEYSWVENYVNAQQGNIWFGQHQENSDAEWTNIDKYDSQWPNWQVDTYYGPGVTGSQNLPLVGKRSDLHGLLSDSPDNAQDSTAMAFRAPKTGWVSFQVKENEPQLRQSPNSGGTVELSLYKNGELLQKVELKDSNTVAQDWKNYLEDNPIYLEKGDFLRVVAHSVGKPTKPSLWISPVITYLDKELPVKAQAEYAAASAKPQQLATATPVVKNADGEEIDVPQGTTFAFGDLPEGVTLAESADNLQPGEVYIDSATGVVSFVPTSQQANSTLTFPVTVTYRNGSANDAEVTFTVGEIKPVLVNITEVPTSNVTADAEDPTSCTVKPFVKITATEGVEFYLNGVRVDPGVITYGYGETVVVEAKALEGYAFSEDATTKWKWTAPTWESLQCEEPQPDQTDAEKIVLGLPAATDLTKPEKTEVSFAGVVLSEGQTLPEGTVLTAEGLPDGLSMNKTTGEISGTLPEVDVDADYEITVTVTYPDNSIGTVTYTLKVTNVPDAKPNPGSDPDPEVKPNPNPDSGSGEVTPGSELNPEGNDQDQRKAKDPVTSDAASSGTIAKTGTSDLALVSGLGLMFMIAGAIMVRGRKLRVARHNS